jgi:beta-lactamase class A
MTVSKSSHPVSVVKEADPCDTKLDMTQREANRLTRPNLLNDENVECGDLSVVKEQLTRYIEDEKKNGDATDVSVYLRKPSTLSWFDINGTTSYMPSSIMKISIMIYYLLKARVDPGILQQKIYFPRHNEELNPQNIMTTKLQEDKYYTVYELMQALMAHSDNDASSLLAKNKFTKNYSATLICPSPIFSTQTIP